MDDRTASLIYETFIMLAHQCTRGYKFGAHHAFILKLLRVEQLSSGHLYQKKMLEDVKRYVHDAATVAFTRELDSGVKHELTKIREMLAAARTSWDVIMICTSGIELLVKDNLLSQKTATGNNAPTNKRIKAGV